jgi:hypothetical protein
MSTRPYYQPQGGLVGWKPPQGVKVAVPTIFYPPVKVWLENWLYRVSHDIYGSIVGTQENYPIMIKCWYGSGTNNGKNVFLNGKCRTDFGDVRFTDSDGTTLLDYYIYEKVDGSYAVFYVKVPKIPSGSIVEEGSWVVDGNTYHYRSLIYIEEQSNNNLTDYQVRLVVNTKALVDANKATSSGNEVRFTDSDGSTLLNFWRENDFNIESTIYWIKIPTLNALSSKIIYMYYDNELTSVPSSSNGSNTFLFFEDFSGTSLDPSKWNTNGFAGFLGIAGYYSLVDGMLKTWGDGTNWRILRAIYNISTSDRVSCLLKTKRDGTNCEPIYALTISTGTDAQRLSLEDLDRDADWDYVYRVNASSYIDYNLGPYSANTWYYVEHVRTDSTSFISKVRNINFAETIRWPKSNSAWNVSFTPVYWQKENVNVYQDFFLIRKCVDPEPICNVIPKEKASIYVYYGNSDKTSISNGKNTFDIFDDFEDGIIDSIWSFQGLSSYYEYGGALVLEANTNTWDNFNTGAHASLSQSLSGYHVLVDAEWVARTDDLAQIFINLKSGTSHVARCGMQDAWASYSGEKRAWAEGGQSYGSGEGTVPASGSARFEIKHFGNAYNCYWGGSPILVGSGSSSISEIVLTNTRYQTYNGKTAKYKIIILRKWVDPEPAHGDWGNEEHK